MTNSVLEELFVVLVIGGASLMGLIPIASLVFAAVSGTTFAELDAHEGFEPSQDLVPGGD